MPKFQVIDMSVGMSMNINDIKPVGQGDSDADI